MIDYMRVALLVRVSTNRQDYDRQISELTLHCQSMNWEIVGIFANKVSGAKKNEEREEPEEKMGTELRSDSNGIYAERISDHLSDHLPLRRSGTAV